MSCMLVMPSTLQVASSHSQQHSHMHNASLLPYFWSLMQRVEIVLTAHPTQVNRRTLQYKHTRIATLLAQNDRYTFMHCQQNVQRA